MDWYAKRRFGDLPQDMVRRFPDREALIFGDERYTFAELSDKVSEAARALVAAGINHGDHVALWLNNRGE
tara:strand:+ start:381 stop:590 length:210 start_codon:yes stop_codon:yes gene_type:complete